MKTRVSSKGQVVIPKIYRQKLGWASGTELTVEEENGQLVLKPKSAIREKQPLSNIVGMLHKPGMKASSIEEMNDAVADSFKDWKV